MKHLMQYRDYEFHFDEEKNTNELIDELVKAIETEEPCQKRKSFTDEELEEFCRKVILELLRKATEEAGLSTIKELMDEIQEPDDAGEEWKDE